MRRFAKVHIRLCFTVLAAVGLSAALASPVGAEEGNRSWSAWASLDLGLGSPYEMGAYANASVRVHRTVFRLRYTTVGEFLGNHREDYGLLVGRVLTPPSSRFQFSVAAGGGLVQGGRSCLFCVSRRFSDTWGVLFDGEARLAVTSFFGVSGLVFGNYNSQESFGGMAIGLYLGQR